MELLYMSFEAMAYFVEYILVYYYLSAFWEINTAKKTCTASILAAILMIGVLLYHSFSPVSEYTVLLIAIYIGLTSKLFFHGNFFQSIVLYGYFFLYSNIIDYCCISILSILTGNEAFANSISQNLSAERCLCIFVSKSLLILFTVLFKRLFSSTVMKSHQILVSLILGYLGLAYMWNLSVSSIDLSSALNWFLLLLLLLLAIFTVSWYKKYMSEKQNKELAQLQHDMLLHTYETLKENSDEIRRIQHDINNHMCVLLDLVDKNDLKKVQAYIESIGFHKSVNTADTWCGNTIVDFLLNFKRKEAQKHHITFTIHADPVDLAFVQDDDLCTIMANLLDNAIEACCKVSNDLRWIQVSIRKIESIIAIKVENSTSSSPMKIDSFFRTSKPDLEKHGFGLRNVQEVADKYGAVFDSTYHDHVFTTTMTFFI